MEDPMPSVFESPDGGNTVYEREFGSSERKIIHEGALRRLQQRSQLWREIFLAARQDAALQEMIDQVEVYYKLKHAHQDNHGI